MRQISGLLRTEPRAAGLLLAVLVCASGLAGCASAPDVPVSQPLPAATADFLLPPTLGYSERLEEGVEAELRSAHVALVQRGEIEAARAAAEALLRVRPGLAPAEVLLAEAELAAGRPQAAALRLRPLVERYPGYAAALLALGRASELAGRPDEAYRAYSNVADQPEAGRRLEVLHDAALQALAGAIERALEQHRVAEAREQLRLLESWDADNAVTWGARRALAAFEGDAEAELEALRRLAELQPDRPAADTARQAELEVEIGDPQSGVALYEDLVNRFPDDEDLAEGLADARFRWRLETLPGEVGELFGKPALTRGDFATILYWLVPGVRSGHAGAGTIVGDVPSDHPQREAIVRVVNLGLLPLEDATLHRFAAERPLLSRVALETSLRLAASAEPPAACAAPLLSNPSPSSRRLCELATVCGLVDVDQACLPAAPLSGAAARRVLRRTLELISGR